MRSPQDAGVTAAGTRRRRPVAPAREGRFTVHRIGVAGVEAIESDTCRAFGRHMHDRFGIGLIVRGAQRSASGRGMVEAAAGDLIAVNPAEVHDGVPMGGARHWRMLYLEPSRVAAVLDDFAAERGAPVCEFAHPVIHNPRAASRFSALFHAVLQQPGDAFGLQADEALALLLENLLDRRLPPSAPPDAPVARARTLIDDDPAAPLTLALLAHEADLSRFQLVRGFARVRGLTPHAYLMQRRVQLARQCIAAGLPLAAAAAASGFADQSHMTRWFARTLGYSPAAYARQRR